MTDHPQWPHGMELDVREAIGDEIDTTLAGFPMSRASATKGHALTVYAEQLKGFRAVDIREGFKAARAKSTTFAPTPTLVRLCVADACKVRRDLEVRAETKEEPRAALSEIPDWRAALRLHVDRIGNGGQP